MDASMPKYEPNLSLNVSLTGAASAQQSGKAFIMTKNRKTFAFENSNWKIGPDFWIYELICLTFVPQNDDEVWIIGGTQVNGQRQKISKYSFSKNDIENQVTEIPNGSIYDCACAGLITPNNEQVRWIVN